MDRRRAPNSRKGHSNPRSPWPPSANYSANSPQSKQLDSKKVEKDLEGHDVQMSNVENSAFDTQYLKLAHDSLAKRDASVLLESFSSNIRNDSPSTPSIHSAKDQSLIVQRAQKEETGHTLEESSLLPVNTTCIVDSTSIGESSQATDFNIKDRLVKNGIQGGKDSQGKIGTTDQSGNSQFCYDICPPRTGPTVRLKPPLLVKNREIRNQNKRSTKDGNILILRPGMILLKSYISFSDQVKLIRTSRDLGLGAGGFYQPGYNDEAKLNLKMMCLGKNWDPVASAYGDERPSDGAKPPPIPDVFSQLVKEAITDSHVHLKERSRKPNVEDILPSMSPNICIVNFYTKSGRLGLHQDKDETRESLCKGLPVVSFSVGDSADFVYSDQRDIRQVETVRLESGDVLIFGGQARHIYHGVTAIYSDTAPQALIQETNLRPGRLNLTFREY